MAESVPRTNPRKFNNEDELRNAVRKIIIELAPSTDGPQPDSARLVEDLAYHSLALLELAFALEDEFDLQPIDEPTARKIQTIADVLNHATAEFKSRGRLS